MKKIAATAMLLLLLTGCAAETVYEPVTDIYGGSDPAPRTVQVMVPEKATVLASAGDNGGQLYFCDGYSLSVQTMKGGDLDRSLRNLTGYDRLHLTLMKTRRGDAVCYSTVWTGVGEEGEQVGRLVLLDDGTYHYAVTVMAPAEQAGMLAEEWDQLLNRVNLSDTGS